MATLPFLEPFYVGSGDFQTPVIQTYNNAQNAVWRRGSILALTTTGTIVNPPATGTGGTGALLGIAGPLPAAVTLATTASAGAPASTYFVIVTYTNAGGTAESAPSQEFVLNVPANYTGSVNVAAAGAPAGATNYAVYVGTQPGLEVRQSTAAGNALGTAYTVPAPLTNNIGLAQAATNQAANIAGLALNNSDALFYNGPGGSFQVGNQSLFGATNSYAPLEPNEIFRTPVIKLGGGAFLEMSMRQAYYSTLDGSTAGLYLDPVSGFYVVDTTQSNKVITILQQSPGVLIGPTANGNIGDIGVRVRVTFNSGTL